MPHDTDIPKPPARNLDVSSSTRWEHVSRHPVFLSVWSSDCNENNELRTNSGPYIFACYVCALIPNYLGEEINAGEAKKRQLEPDEISPTNQPPIRSNRIRCELPCVVCSFVRIRPKTKI
jgi:hypothetical protein